VRGDRADGNGGPVRSGPVTTTAELSDVDDDEVVRDLLLEAYRSELKKESRSGISGPIGAERRYSSE
jgi:hypothetical protein